VHSQRVLLALTQKGMSREDAYTAVQRNAMKVWRGEGQFADLLEADPDIRPHLGKSEINHLFDLGYHYKNIDRIFARVFED
jgi:adenylosuccinate lyase